MVVGRRALELFGKACHLRKNTVVNGHVPLKITDARA